MSALKLTRSTYNSGDEYSECWSCANFFKSGQRIYFDEPGRPYCSRDCARATADEEAAEEIRPQLQAEFDRGFQRGLRFAAQICDLRGARHTTGGRVAARKESDKCADVIRDYARKNKKAL